MKLPWAVPLTLAPIAIALLLAGKVWASAPFEIPWYTVDGGGGASSGGVYNLTGAVGQPDAGALSGSGYTLAGGFFAGSADTPRIFLPMIVR